MEHDLKILPKYFDAIANGFKNFDVRDAEDRDFQVGDTVEFNEYLEEFPTGRSLKRAISYILDDFPSGLQSNYVVLGLVRRPQ